MEIFGMIAKEKTSFFVDEKKKKNQDLFIFMKGKIFNTKELIKKYNIKSNKIEELISYLYKNNNISFVDELDGNFAIIIYDQKINKLFLIKDKLGNVPLYYYHEKDNFMFSTSLKSIMNDTRFPKKISKKALSIFLGYMYIYEPYTIFENTYKVEKGTIISYKNNKIKKLNYFNLWDEYENTKKIKKVKEEVLVDEFTNLFENSIQKYGNRDSQVGVFMSSGKDSTLIAKLASEYYKKPINTYTLGFENERDETLAAKKIANFIGSNHHSIILKDEYVLETIKKMPDIYEEPFADPSLIPNIYMTENIKDKNDFYLTGEGNDAVFIMGAMYKIFDFYPRQKLRIRKIEGIKNHKRVYRNFSELAQTNVIKRFSYSDNLIGMKGEVYQLRREKEKIRSSVLGDLCNTVSEKYRVKTGSLARYHHYDYYTPYYTEEILKKTFEIPTNMIYKNQKGKYIFEKVLYNKIPKEYYDSYKKNGFGVPLADWVKRLMLPDIKKTLDKDKILKQDLFIYENLKEFIDDFEKKPNYSKAVVVWCYYIFELWYQKNIDN